MSILGAQAIRVNRGAEVPGAAGFGPSSFMGEPAVIRPAAPFPRPTATVDATSRDLYGYDIMFDRSQFPLAPNGDYTRVEGLANLRLAVYRRLITRPGEFRYRPEYGAGVGLYVKRAMTQAVLDELRQTILDQLSQDRRIQEVTCDLTPALLAGDVPALKVYIRVTTGGNPVVFEPFTFLENA